MTPAEEERKFIHDLSNPLSIAYGGVRLITTKLEMNLDSISKEDILTRLKKTINSFERINLLIDKRRENLKSQSEDAS